jgi:hypothetical protein
VEFIPSLAAIVGDLYLSAFAALEFKNLFRRLALGAERPEIPADAFKYIGLIVL